MNVSDGTRCPVCEARALGSTARTLRFPSGRARAFALACGFCGLLLDREADAGAVRRDLAGRLSGEAFAPDEAAPYGLDLYTLRIAAGARRRGVEPADAAQAEALRRPHSALAGVTRLVYLAAGPTVGVALGILCRPAELDAVLAALRPHATWAEAAVVLVDDAPAGPAPRSVPGFDFGAVRVASRPLGGDFAAQRNALQALSPCGWMMQLDADETLDEDTGALLGALAARAEREGTVSIGLPRRNRVDGVLSDLHPDTQYRLNRRDVRFVGRVHERPERDWRVSTIALHGAIEHRLARAHVEARSARYEALDPGRGRPEEVRLLLAPYRF